MFRIITILLEKYKDVNEFYVLRMDEKFETQQSDIKYLIYWLSRLPGRLRIAENEYCA